MHADWREENKESVPYDAAFLAMMHVYQMLMGDAQHESFYKYQLRKPEVESKTPDIMYALYMASSFFIMIMLLNIIIAIMNDT